MADSCQPVSAEETLQLKPLKNRFLTLRYGDVEEGAGEAKSPTASPSSSLSHHRVKMALIPRPYGGGGVLVKLSEEEGLSTSVPVVGGGKCYCHDAALSSSWAAGSHDRARTIMQDEGPSEPATVVGKRGKSAGRLETHNRDGALESHSFTPRTRAMSLPPPPPSPTAETRKAERWEQLASLVSRSPHEELLGNNEIVTMRRALPPEQGLHLLAAPDSNTPSNEQFPPAAPHPHTTALTLHDNNGVVTSRALDVSQTSATITHIHYHYHVPVEPTRSHSSSSHSMETMGLPTPAKLLRSPPAPSAVTMEDVKRLDYMESVARARITTSWVIEFTNIAQDFTARPGTSLERETPEPRTAERPVVAAAHRAPTATYRDLGAYREGGTPEPRTAERPVVAAAHRAPTATYRDLGAYQEGEVIKRRVLERLSTAPPSKEAGRQLLTADDTRSERQFSEAEYASKLLRATVDVALRLHPHANCIYPIEEGDSISSIEGLRVLYLSEFVDWEVNIDWSQCDEQYLTVTRDGKHGTSNGTRLRAVRIKVTSPLSR